MSLDPTQFRNYVIDPVLRQMVLYSPAASNLLLGTALQESALTYLHQLGKGPALGLYQIEPATHQDILANYLPGHPQLYARLMGLKCLSLTDDGQLMMNLAYATAMCRIFYLRIPEPLPDGGDAHALAAYWKQFYNTPAGAGTVEQALPHFKTAIAA